MQLDQCFQLRLFEQDCEKVWCDIEMEIFLSVPIIIVIEKRLLIFVAS